MAASFNSVLANTASAQTENENSTAEQVSNENQIMTLSLEPDDGFHKINNPSYFWIDSYTDNDYSIVDNLKNIVVNQNQINITQEENSQVIPFEIPRYYDGIDLSQMFFQIHYLNSEDYEGLSTPINVMCSEDKIRFYWLIDGSVTAIKGKVRFEIRASGSVLYSDSNGNQYSKDYVWKTRPSDQINILESLNGNGSIEPSEGWDTYLQQVSNLVSQASSSAEQARRYATQAASSATQVEQKITTVSDDITSKVTANMTEELSKYYTSDQVDDLINSIDISDQLQGIQDQIDNFDGLAALRITYDPETDTLSFYNDEEIIESIVLDMTPSASWVESYTTAVDSKISEADSALKTEIMSEVDEKIGSIDISDQLDSLKQSIENNYYNSTEIDSKLEEKANSSTVTALSSSVSALQDKVGENSSTITSVSESIANIQADIEKLQQTPGATYETTYDASTGEFKLIETTIVDDEEIQKVVSQHIITGGSGGSTTSTTIKIDRIEPTSSLLTITNNDKAIIKYSFSSIDSSGDDTGEGTAVWKVDNTTVATTIAIQGENTFDLTEYVTVGSHKVSLTITDSAGSIAAKNWTVQVVDVRLESTFNDTYTYSGDVSFSYTPYGSIEKTVHFILDGEELPSVTTSVSGIPMSYILPEQEHGAHLLEVYMTAVINNVDIETNHIYKDIIWYDESTNIPVIGCVSQNITAMQYDNINITYTVYDPKTETPTVILAVDDEIVSTLTLDSSTNIWQYKSSEVGPHTLTITCGETVKTIIVTIEKLNINISPVTANLAFDFNPVGYSNNSVDRLWTDGTVSMTVSDNFDWTNGGYQLDENGDQYFCIKAGTSALIDYKLFADDAKKNGKEFKLVFKTTNVQSADAKFLSCIDNTTDTNHIGIEMFVHEAYVYAGSTERLHLPYSEEDIIEFEFNINNNQEVIPMVMGYEDGVSTCPLVYDESYNFTQNTPKYISLGSDKCDLHIYRLKVYTASLSAQNILNNFIADARNANEMIDRYNRNQIYDENQNLTAEYLAEKCPWLRIIKLEAPYFTNNKSDKVKNTTIKYIYKNGDPVLDNWTAYNCQHSGQGTSSNNYGAAGRNLDLIMNKSGYEDTTGVKPRIVLGDGSTEVKKVSLTRDSVDVNYFNVKVNIASSENANNALLQRRYNTYNPYKRSFIRNDESEIAKIKDTMEFYNCVVFIKENDTDISTHREFADNNWHFYAIGNIGDSKKTDKTRLTDPTDKYECVVEIMDVELPLSDFPAGEEALATLEADKFDEKGTYGWRYIWEDGTDEENAEVASYCKQKWIDFYKFVVNSSDEEFHDKLGDYFVIDSALYYYLFTTRYTMVDNRAKNTFWHYGKTGDVDLEGNPIRKWDLSFDYDNDTSLGINNYGDMVYRYGYEDTDYEDGTTQEVFRESDSTFFCRIRDLFSEELKTMYNNLESDNAWHAEGLINQFDTWQSEFPEELWRVDIERKYLRTYNSSFINGAGDHQFLRDMAHGKKKYQRRQFERNQEKYMASKYQSTLAASDNMVMRCTVPAGELAVEPNYKLKLTPYSYMYLNVKYGTQAPITVRATPGVEYEIPFEGRSTDIINIYSASSIQSIGDLSTCYPATLDTSKGTKLKELIVGNSTEGYDNPNLSTLTLGANYLLETLNIENISGLTQSINLSALANLRELYAHGSNIGGVTFANGGLIEIAELPAINSITMKNLVYLTTLDIVSLNKLTTLTVENCSTVDLITILKNSPNLNRVRITGIDWQLDDVSLLESIYNMGGIDSKGYNVDRAVLSGSVYVPVIREQMLFLYNQAWPDLSISYGTMITQFAVTFINDDGTILDVQYVDSGSKPVDPITREVNPIPVPTKESTVSTDYTFANWDSEFVPVFSTQTITATYSESLRKYTIKYVSKGTVLQETVADYSSYVEYTGSVPTYTIEESGYKYYIFDHWDQSGFVNGNKTINAVYDSCSYSSGYFDGKELAELRPVEIYALTMLEQSKILSVSDLFTEGDSVSFTLGHDYSYDDVESVDIITETTTFTGKNYIDTGIQLLNEDRDFILAIDYEFAEGNESNATLMECFQANGSSGFKLSYSSTVKCLWGTESKDLTSVNCREMLVIRHLKGDNNLYIYSTNFSADDILVATIEKTKSTTCSSTLVLGCSKPEEDAYENNALGKINWCKLWYTDLGDTACRSLATWTHEEIDLEICGFKRYYMSDNTSKRCSFSLLASHLLETTKKMNTSDSNLGGFSATSLFTFLNERLYAAIPVQWKSLIKRVQVSSSAGNKSSEIITSDCYVTIPAVIEVNSTISKSPYPSEGTPISYMTTNDSRKRGFRDGEVYQYWLRSPNVDYTNYFFSVQTSGEVWGYNSPLYQTYGVLIEISL